MNDFWSNPLICNAHLLFVILLHHLKSAIVSDNIDHICVGGVLSLIHSETIPISSLAVVLADYDSSLLYRPTRAIAMDCEFVGIGYGGKESVLARVSIVNQFGHVLLDEFVRPKEKITDYRTHVSGITPHLMRPDGPAKEFTVVHKTVADLCDGRILVGHAVHHDLKV